MARGQLMVLELTIENAIVHHIIHISISNTILGEHTIDSANAAENNGLAQNVLQLMAVYCGTMGMQELTPMLSTKRRYKQAQDMTYGAENTFQYIPIKMFTELNVAAVKRFCPNLQLLLSLFFYTKGAII